MFMTCQARYVDTKEVVAVKKMSYKGKQTKEVMHVHEQLYAYS